MSLGKMPGIKGLVSGSQGKRRFKSDLSVDMISPPLGDFRHTMHVGRGGDVFGDTSFLSNHGGQGETGDPDSSTSSSKTTQFLTRTLRHVRKTPAPRPRGGSRDLSPPPPPISPIIKNAISLPQLNVDSPNGCLKRVLFPSSASSPGDSCSYGLQSGFVTLPRLSRMDRQLDDGDNRCGSFPEKGDFSMMRSDSLTSLTSFTVDLGPSLMSEVLGLIDSPSCQQMTSNSWLQEDKEEEEEQSSIFEMAVESPTLSSPNPSMGSTPVRAHANPKDRSCSSEWTEHDEDSRSLKTPDASMGSPVRAEPTMEAERFQRAANVLARHYGGGSFSRVRSPSEEGLGSDSALSASSLHGHNAPYAFADEEEEIKV